MAHELESLRVELVDPARALLFVAHEAGVLEDAQVLRDGGAADVELAGDVADGHRAFEEEPGEDGPAGAVAEGVELRLFVSIH